MSPKKKRPGRPRMARSERSEAVVTLRMRRAEKRQLEGAARAAGTTLSEWARKVLISASSA